MIYCTVGIPSRFSEWCEMLLATLVAAASRSPSQFIAESLDQVGLELLAHDDLHAIVVSRQPQQALTKALLDRPVMVTLDNPTNTMASLIADHGLARAEAVRVVANAMAAVLPLVSSSNAIVLKADRPVSALAVAAHFDLPLSEQDAEAVFERCPPQRPLVAPQAPAPEAASPSAAIARAVVEATGPLSAESALASIWKHVNGDALDEIVWSPELFILAQSPRSAPTEPIDVTGGARSLLYGPYIRLPEGPWSCTILFGCTQSGARLAAEVFAGVLLNRVIFDLNETGIFEIELSFVNSNPDIPIEVRLFTAEAAFEGEFVLGQVRMKPLKARRLTVA